MILAIESIKVFQLCDTAIVTPVGLDSCDFAFLNWGDGTTSTIFNGNSSLDHKGTLMEMLVGQNRYVIV